MLLSLFCVSLVVLVAGLSVTGINWGWDTDDYLEVGAAFVREFANTGKVVDPWGFFIFPHYLVSASVLAAIHTCLGLGSEGVVVLNLVLFGVTVSMMFELWNLIFGIWDRRHTRQVVMISAVGGLYIVMGLPDGVYWTYYVLTETIFMFWIAAFVFVTVKGFVTERIAWWILGLVLALSAPFVRPTGLIVPLIYLVCLIAQVVPWIRSRFWLFSGAIFLIVTGLAFLVAPWLVVMDVRHDPFVDEVAPDLIRESVRQAAVFFTEGVAVEGRVEHLVSQPISYVEIIGMMVSRLVYFWVPLRLSEPAYSAIHNGVNFVYIVLTLPLVAVGLRHLVAAGESLRWVAFFLVLLAYGYALLHAVTLVAFDWRYQLPAMVPYWVLAGCGLHCVLLTTGRSNTRLGLGG